MTPELAVIISVRFGASALFIRIRLLIGVCLHIYTVAIVLFEVAYVRHLVKLLLLLLAKNLTKLHDSLMLWQQMTHRCNNVQRFIV